MCSLALDYLPEMTPLNEHFAAQDAKISRGADTRVHPRCRANQVRVACRILRMPGRDRQLGKDVHEVARNHRQIVAGAAAA
jgi:hypothetical protein